MGIENVIEYFSIYGMWLVFLIVFLEYLNLPGLPAGIIMPAAGILIATSEWSFTYSLFVSVIAGLLGSIVLYYIGYFLGRPVVDKMYNKYPKMQGSIDKTFNYVDKYGNKGIFISRLIPVARTLISLAAGVFNINIFKFLMYSTVGITVWNFGFIFVGYIAGKIFL